MIEFYKKSIGFVLVLFFTTSCSTSYKMENQEDAEGCVMGNCKNGVGIYNEYSIFNMSVSNPDIKTIDTKYVGEFQNGKKHGKGKLTIYTRDWFGSLYIKDVYPKKIYIGTWNNGKLNGETVIGEHYNRKTGKYEKANTVTYYNGSRIKPGSRNFTEGITLGDVIAAGVVIYAAKMVIDSMTTAKNSSNYSTASTNTLDDTSSNTNPKKAFSKKNIAKGITKKIKKYSGGVKKIRKRSDQYGKYESYEITCNGGGKDSFYKFKDIAWRRIGLIKQSYSAHKNINQLAKEHCR